MLAAYRCAAPSVPGGAGRGADRVGVAECRPGRGVRGIMTSGRSVEVLIGPAGTGKSYTLARLAEHWHEASRRAGDVVALTVSENAAGVLRSEGIDNAMNLERWFRAQGRIARAQASVSVSPSTTSRSCCAPASWFEASMASTDDLNKVLRLAEAQGAKVLLAGDDQQLDAVGAEWRDALDAGRRPGAAAGRGGSHAAHRAALR